MLPIGVLAAITARHIMPKMWFTELFLAGGRLYITVGALTLLLLLGEVLIMTRQLQSSRDGRRRKDWTVREVFGRATTELGAGWWITWIALALMILLLSFL